MSYRALALASIVTLGGCLVNADPPTTTPTGATDSSPSGAVTRATTPDPNGSTNAGADNPASTNSTTSADAGSPKGSLGESEVELTNPDDLHTADAGVAQGAAPAAEFSDSGGVPLADGAAVPSSSVPAGTFQAPSRLAFSRSGTNRVLSWQDNSDGETSFDIEYRKGTTGEFTSLRTVRPNTTSVELPELSPGDHYFRIQAVREGGDPACSAIAGMLIVGATGTPDAPVAPFVKVNAVRTPTESTLTFQWSPVDFKEAAGGCPSEDDCGYRIYETSMLYPNGRVRIAGKTATQIVFPYNDFETSYYISVYNRFGDSGRSYIATFR